MTTTHVMKPRPPLRAFGLAAVLAVVGMGFVIAPDVTGWHVILRAIGIALLLVGLAILGLAVLAVQRFRMEVVLDDEGYRVVSPTGTREGAWAEVVKVTRGERRLVLHRRDGTRIAVTQPRGGAGDLNALGTDIARRLDASRGYTNLPLGFPDSPEPADSQ